jgi:hypothetical protein
MKAIRSIGLKIYPLTADQKPLDASRLTCMATFVHPNAPEKTWFEIPCRVALPPSGKAPSALNLDVDLSTVPATGAKVTVEIEGLSDTTVPRARFTVPFALKVPPTVVFATATRADEPAIAAQKVCKVSGEELTSMRGPLKVTRGDQSVLICCLSCLKDIKASPDKFFVARNVNSGQDKRAPVPKH